MNDSIVNWDGDDWEKYVRILLRVKHGVDFVEVPSKDQGDLGIEGFSRTGHAYQCYAAEEPLDTKSLFEKQRDKMTTDLAKLISNQADLVKLLGTTKLEHWCLVVPRHESKRLIQHATQKADEIRKAVLPFISPNFQVDVLTEDSFPLEKAVVAKNGLAQIHLVAPKIASEIVDEWVSDDDNNELLQNIDRKIESLKPTGSKADKLKLRGQIVLHYLRGRNTKERLRTDYPELWEIADRSKTERETFLETECGIPTGAPPDTFAKHLDRFREDVKRRLTALDEHSVELLVWEAVSDWLLRCPLDFPATTQPHGS